MKEKKDGLIEKERKGGNKERKSERKDKERKGRKSERNKLSSQLQHPRGSQAQPLLDNHRHIHTKHQILTQPGSPRQQSKPSVTDTALQPHTTQSHTSHHHSPSHPHWAIQSHHVWQMGCDASHVRLSHAASRSHPSHTLAASQSQTHKHT